MIFKCYILLINVQYSTFTFKNKIDKNDHHPKEHLMEHILFTKKVSFFLAFLLLLESRHFTLVTSKVHSWFLVKSLKAAITLVNT